MRDPALEGLFPPWVRTAQSRAEPDEAILCLLERNLLQGMAPARRRAFAQGRLCAGAALAGLGVVSDGVGMGANRQPLWPAGAVGSISHTGGWAVAAVARRTNCRSLGIDLERFAVLEPEVLRLVARPEEQGDRVLREWMGGCGASLLFCIKESIYKCMWPVLEHYVDFQDVAVAIDQDAGAYGVSTRSDRVPAEVAGSIHGRFRVVGDWVVSSAWISA